jgi:hypothetical protein
VCARERACVHVHASNCVVAVLRNFPNKTCAPHRWCMNSMTLGKNCYENSYAPKIDLWNHTTSHTESKRTVFFTVTVIRSSKSKVFKNSYTGSSCFMPGLRSWKTSCRSNTKFSFKTTYFQRVTGLTTSSYIVYDYTTSGNTDL